MGSGALCGRRSPLLGCGAARGRRLSEAVASWTESAGSGAAGRGHIPPRKNGTRPLRPIVEKYDTTRPALLQLAAVVQWPTVEMVVCSIRSYFHV